MNPHLDSLRPYPFERLRQRIDGVTPPSHFLPIAMSIGEPRHPAPDFLVEALRSSLHTLDRYPLALGLVELRQAAARWLERRFSLPAGVIDPDHMGLPAAFYVLAGQSHRRGDGSRLSYARTRARGPIRLRDRRR